MAPNCNKLRHRCDGGKEIIKFMLLRLPLKIEVMIAIPLFHRFEDGHPLKEHPISLDASVLDIAKFVESILPADYDFDLLFYDALIYGGLEKIKSRKSCAELGIIQSSVVTVQR